MPDDAWTEARLQRMIGEKIPESSSLEYKRSAALTRNDKAKVELSKDVSAFANAGGGTLIYGIAENDKRQEPETLDEGIDPSTISKEWLDDVISSSIHRKIDGVRIHVVPLSETRAGRVAYVIEVPQSQRGAHMAADKKYYKRHNFKSEPMEEYEVRDVYARGTSPLLRIGAFPAGNIVISHEELRANLGLELINEGREPATVARLEIDLDGRVYLLNRQWTESTAIRARNAGDRFLPIRSTSFPWGGADQFPVFDGSPALLVTLPIRALLGTGAGPFVLWWRVQAPRFAGNEGLFVFEWNVRETSFSVQDATEDDLHLFQIAWPQGDQQAVRFALEAEQLDRDRRR